MSRRTRNGLLGGLALMAAICATPAEQAPTAEQAPDARGDMGLDALLNYRSYSPIFASAGQPTREQLELVRDAGFERVVYIAFSDSGTAFADEDVVVKGLSMDYLHIPVAWSKPQPGDFEAFAAYMRLAPEAKTLLHCQVNARASAFSFLYRVIYQDVPVARAKADMNTVWRPNATWRDFIFTVLDRHGISPACEGCDWTPPEPG